MGRKAERVVSEVRAEHAHTDPGVGDEDEVAQRLDEGPLAIDLLDKANLPGIAPCLFNSLGPHRLDTVPRTDQSVRVVGEQAVGRQRLSLVPGERWCDLDPLDFDCVGT